MSTDQRLIAAAASLLDAGGEEAVTLRAVGRTVGVSHNAPYRHFRDRGALLAAVATADFLMLTDAFEAVARSDAEPAAKIGQALQAVVGFAHEHPARYRLLFSDPAIAAHGGELESAALQAFGAFAAIIAEAQGAGKLPDVPNPALAGLLYAATHGLIDLEASGRLRPAKGLGEVTASVTLLLRLLSKA